MTTIDTEFPTISISDPAAGLAGVPAAAELEALANSLFPDLTKDFDGAGVQVQRRYARRESTGW